MCCRTESQSRGVSVTSTEQGRVQTLLLGWSKFLRNAGGEQLHFRLTLPVCDVRTTSRCLSVVSSELVLIAGPGVWLCVQFQHGSIFTEMCVCNHVRSGSDCTLIDNHLAVHELIYCLIYLTVWSVCWALLWEEKPHDHWKPLPGFGAEHFQLAGCFFSTLNFIKLFCTATPV